VISTRQRPPAILNVMPTLVSDAFVEAHLTPFLPVARREVGNAAVRRGITFGIPADAGRRCALAKLLASEMGESDVIVAYEEWNVWPSSEMMDLFLRVRRSEGITSTLEDADVELIAASETPYLECVCACGLYFFWDFALISPSLRTVVFASHDEALSVFCDGPNADSFMKNLRAFFAP
jgi:hypothetical protein